MTHGPIASPLANKTAGDLELAKHLCDRYTDCQWFNGWGHDPGAIGRYSDCPAYDTFIRQREGRIIERGSLYFPTTEYLRIPGHVNTFCQATVHMNASTPAANAPL